ncbi:MAG: hypothetical protein B7X59_02960 [Polaromonas sp. 39-63-203]|jgi:hypothetical protein|uniref:hypothetical protein n=1 Tax=Polaromonas sp. TaxID=1869339 RepID=UPI000BD26FEC|nr:hypothetical protein [Polaromonas sp.]OYY53949.1 MAG: hypothetical protein B7Y54_00930 [Polaromonas sp. 35-63-240]OYZ03385.1 MAG: hypothetical protein B7Y42_00875 [Polaromonas sp. 28-63-22]OYZ84983.1 MAG: hypothetical protein B7Y03_01265 [Polaromonas sp. 24-62-144]OZB00166.1 MAG: hypothetical protein B7X59_02960 [Polaromonas sp. 39-63-203]HQS31623.1 hypothetical protein [Polaromonas sp.]
MSHHIPSKDIFFSQLARLSDEMIAAYDKDFAMGALVLAARFIAERDRAAADAGSSADQQPPSPPSVLQ